MGSCLVCIHSGNPRVPPRVLASGPKPCGGNKFLVFKFNNTGTSGHVFFSLLEKYLCGMCRPRGNKGIGKKYHLT